MSLLFQITARLLTFGLNQLLVRLVDPQVFGAANIQLELLLSTILFLAREAVRTVLVRRKQHSNAALLPIPIGLALSIPVAYTYAFHLAESQLKLAKGFQGSVCLYVAGAMAELVIEPLYLRALTLGNLTLRAKAESLAVLTKCLITIAALSRTSPLLAFGLGQFSYGLTLLAIYWASFLLSQGLSATVDLYVPRRRDGALFEPGTLSLCWAMTKQGLLKHLLTEGDKLAVAKFASLSDQGGYALATAYGSLVARIIFQPVEETVRVVFSQSQAERSAKLLATLYRAHALLGLLLVTFGAPLAVPFLYLMAGPQWALQSSAPAILAAYTWYLPVMGINGIAEGFFQSVATKQQVERYNTILVAASGLFAASLWADSAGTGLVRANALSLAVRACYCWYFSTTLFKGDQAMTPKAALPRWQVTAVFAAVFTALRSLRDPTPPASKVDAIRSALPLGGTSLVICLVTM